MDKITYLSYILYQLSNRPEVKDKAIQLLNGDVSLHDLKKSESISSELSTAESLLKTKKVNKILVQDFVTHFLLVEA